MTYVVYLGPVVTYVIPAGEMERTKKNNNKFFKRKNKMDVSSAPRRITVLQCGRETGVKFTRVGLAAARRRLT